MKKKIILLVIILFIVTAIFTIGKYAVNGKQVLVNPLVTKAVVQPTTAPVSIPQTPAYNAPKEIKYDSGTDLQTELDSVNPQVLDSDFEE